jgi:predicted amidohydrolase
MRIGACQTPEILGDVEAAFEHVRQVAGRSGADVDLLLFPECFLSGYLVTEDYVREHALDPVEVAERLGDLRPMLVVGLIERHDGRYYNTALVLERGRILGAYRKTFLTAGEAVFTAGDTYPTFACAGVRFGLNICYDTQFPQAAAAVADAGATLLLVPAQNMMPRERAFAWEPEHNRIRARRVRETGLWLASADVTGARGDRLGLGPTCVLDPAGRVVARVPAGSPGVAIAAIG